MIKAHESTCSAVSRCGAIGRSIVCCSWINPCESAPKSPEQALPSFCLLLAPANKNFCARLPAHSELQYALQYALQRATALSRRERHQHTSPHEQAMGGTSTQAHTSTHTQASKRTSAEDLLRPSLDAHLLL